MKFYYCPHELPATRWRLWREDWPQDRFLIVSNSNFQLFKEICETLGIELVEETECETG